MRSDCIKNWYWDGERYKALTATIKVHQQVLKSVSKNSSFFYHIQSLICVCRMERAMITFHWAVKYGRRDDAMYWRASFQAWHQHCLADLKEKHAHG